ncbi:MAG TPA: bifunctional salicylyl-CoA 5-hydroxylase/oxidoreductase [Longimicrobiaceae bacterium]|nr:bifunctional salicylyl-CoA 5-hydroxylase/oxidoreductase [Longimicrobiaceae bacterium]
MHPGADPPARPAISRPLKVAILGGGPAGLYLALLLRKANPAHRVTVLERNRPDDTFGWGVVFSDQTLGNLRAADEESYRAIADNFAHWDDIDIHFRGRTITSGGHGFSGIARVRLLEILQERAACLGAELRFQCEVPDDAALADLGLGDADLVVGADGVNSLLRRTHAERFLPDLDVRTARFAWFGTTRRFDAFTFVFVENEHGVFQVHAYRFDDRRSAFIVECDEASWRAAGLDRMDTAESLAWSERTFAPWLEGHPLESNARHLASPWLTFTRVSNQRWHFAPEDGGAHRVLIGDAAHTAHFSIGSGTKLAMEDSIALARLLGEEPELERALEAYQEERRTEALRLQNAARNSMEWFENVRRYVHLEPEQFAYSLLTRSQRVSHENLRLRDGAYLGGVERWFASRASAGGGADEEPETVPPPMFTPFRLRGVTFANRVVVAPMDMYSAEDGTPNDFHLVHLGERALGGAGLVFTEMTCVSPEGRITPGCTGMYRPEHVDAWRRIVDFVHRWTPAKLALQLGHSGRRGSVRVPWEGGDVPLPEGNWEVMGPSPLAHAPGMHLPREMTRADMDEVVRQFVRAAELGMACGFDLLELHCAHGYLLSSFITPLANRRTDEYGGSLENRLRFPLEVFRALRNAWPEDLPTSVRISATDWVEGGVTGEESVRIARAFGEAGCDLVHVSTGQTSPDARPVYGRAFQTPYSDRIRNEAGVATIAVGNITEADQVNAIVTAGRADLCALARPHLANPHWTLHAAAEQGYAGQPWPVQYLTGKTQLERNLQRQKELLAGGGI